MRLAYIIEHIAGTGGMERNISSKSNYLVEELGYELTIITIYQQGRPYAYGLSPLIKTVDLEVNFAGKSSCDIKEEISKKLEKVLYREHFDICVSWGGMDSYSLYKIKDGSKKILEFHFDYAAFEMWSQAYNSRLKARTMAFVKRMLFINAARHYEKFVLLTKQDQLRWKRFCNNTTYIYNPLFLQKEIYPDKPKNSHKVCAMGRLDYNKGYDLLISIWKKVAEKHPDWKLYIYGEGDEQESLQELILLEGLTDNVKLCGYCADVGSVFSQSDFFVFPSRFEGFGNVLVEAMAYGLPPVSFDCPCGPKEIIENNVSGFLVPYMDLDSFAEKINELIENEALRNRMSLYALKRSNQFSMNSIMQQWDSLFHNISDN